MSKRYSLTGVGTTLEIGKGASLLKSSGADLQVRVSGDSAYANMSGLDATASTHFVTLSQLQSQVNGLAWKEPVRGATTAAGTLASDFENGDVIDTSVTLATGNRILIKNQASGVENGIYTVNATGAPTRASDLPAAASAASIAVFVQEGTSNADVAFTCTNDSGSDVVGTDALVFQQFANITAGVTSVNDATTVPGGGASLIESGGTGAVTLRVLDDSSRIAYTVAGGVITPDIVAGSIDTTQLADNSVTEPKLAPLAAVGTLRVAFSFSDQGSTVTIGTVPTNGEILEVKIVIDTAFNDSGTTLLVGTSGTPSLFQAATDNDATATDVYITDHMDDSVSATALIITVGGSANSAGAGFVMVKYQVTA